MLLIANCSRINYFSHYAFLKSNKLSNKFRNHLIREIIFTDNRFNYIKINTLNEKRMMRLRELIMGSSTAESCGTRSNKGRQAQSDFEKLCKRKALSRSASMGRCFKWLYSTGTSNGKLRLSLVLFVDQAIV